MTTKNILTLASLKPTTLVTVPLATFTRLGNSLTYEEIISVFKTYRPMDKGNTKLCKGILSFSLIPVVTCDQSCAGCYDKRSLRYPSVRLKRIVNTILASTPKHNNKLFRNIQLQIKRSRTVSAIRIHVGGDFFSADYSRRWQDIAQYTRTNKPCVNIYTYTKTGFTRELTIAGINVVKSKLSDGTFNFGPADFITRKAKEVNGIVCPATIRTVKDGYCGSKCKACQTQENVFFVIH